MIFISTEPTVSMLKLILLLWVMHLTFVHTVDRNIVRYITPSPTTQCPGESCLTLSTLAANSSIYFDPNMTVVLLKGNHTLDSELVVSNINGSLMLSTNGLGTAAIVCSGNASLQFFHIIQLQISGLEFIRCSSKVELVDQFTLENSNFYGGNNDSALYINHTNASITGSSFVSNTAGTYQSHVLGLALLQYPSVNVSVSWLRSNIQSTSARVGGALTVTSSNVTISSSRFERNTAKVGGAIFSQEESSINISDCTFINNSAIGCSDDGCHGGALFIDSGCTVIAHNSIVINNTAGYSGGAFALFQGTFLDSAHNVISGNTAGTFGGAISAFSWSWIVIDNSRYYNNTGKYGGAIYIHSYSSITMDNSSFNKNEASLDGGVLFAWYSCSITVANSSFEKNNAVDLGGVMLAYFNSSITVSYSFFYGGVAGHNDGGVMYVSFNSCVTVDSSTLDHNKAGVNGGSIVARSNSSIFVSNSSFENNTAGNDGGVMSAFFSSSITVGNSTFNNNLAIDDGGVIYAQDSGSSVTVGNCFFGNNMAGDNGGVMGAYYSSIIIENSSFENNTADNDGGVMSAFFSSSITVGNSTFNNNLAIDDGGVIYAEDSGSSVTVGNCFFGNNMAGDNGGVMGAYYSSIITIKNSSFDNNTAVDHGGVMVAYFNGNITVINSYFDINTASRYDGGVMFAAFNSSISLSNSYFGDNRAGGVGGVAYAVQNSSITVGSNFFNNNEADNSGGVLHAQISSNITVSNSSFVNSKVENSGGVMVAHSKSNIAVDNSFFNNNTAGVNGGVMFAYSQSSIVVGNSFFANSIAGRGGGVIFAYFNSSISVSDSFFENNEADGSGGVLFGERNSSITVSNSSFGNNKAARHGGVMNVYSNSNIVIGVSFFDNNTANGDGGVIYASSSSNVSVGNSSFYNNKAGENGGVVYARSSSIVVSSYTHNSAKGNGGMTYLEHLNRKICFNRADISGGVICLLLNSELNTMGDNINEVGDDGGALYASTSRIIVDNSSFHDNTASNGGVITLNDGFVEITASRFVNNSATNSGGVLYTPSHHLVHVVCLQTSHFINNSAIRGGAIVMLFSATVTVIHCIFTHNNAIRGGAIYLLDGSNFTASYSNFTQNSAKDDGGVIYLERLNRLSFENCQVTFNRADINGGVICLLLNSELNIMGDNNNFTGNQALSGGVAYVRESNINVRSQALSMVNNTAHSGGAMHVSSSRVDIYNGSLLMTSNTAKDTGGAVYLAKSNLSFVSGDSMFERNVAKTGGAVYLDESQVVFSGGSSMLIRNRANDGGALYLSDSKVIVETDSQTMVDANLAAHHGGGLYLTKSEVNIRGNSSFFIINRANNKGGGVHAINSSIIVEGAINFVSNEAEDGGGISLETNARLHGTSAGDGLINFVRNKASHYGGALFVDDYTNPDMCAAVSITNTTPSIECFSKSVFINVSDNSAGVSGSALFGGHLDRCTVDSGFLVKNEIYELGIMSFLNSSNIKRSQLYSIASHPVRLCLCRDGEPDCNYKPEPIQVNRGRSFSIELIVYDQVRNAVSASIQCHHNLSAGGLGEGQRIQIINTKCTELKYKVFTTNQYASLTFSAVRDPCSNISEISKQSIIIHITCACPIGFQVIINDDKASCDCVCDPLLQLSKIIECNQTTKSIIRRENCWISYILNHTSSFNSSGYIIYPHCPFDYCYSPDQQVSINLNLPNGSDAQCDFDRMGTLCGTCKPGHSVSLGSSKCLSCPIYWPGVLVIITIVFIISGIGLVAFLLALNLTVAIGTLNAIIFYANIIAANKSAFFPTGISFQIPFVILSWLNFDFGFDVCFYNGMDTYVKTWLQLAFPAYIIILVVVVIKLSYYFSIFGRLVGKKDPVATLATLILLSYTKFLQTIITAFSPATLVYPDGSKKMLWLPDATVTYGASKHAVLFFIAILILVIGFIYTLLLFSWQWLLCCPRKRVKRIRNQKLSSFIEIYLTPYTPKHRYWTGLLLLVRVGMYLVSAFNPSGDPRVTLLATNFVMTSLFLYIATFSVRMYKNCFINTMETLTYFNIMALALFTWYSLEADTNQTAITNLSVSVTFIQLIIVIVYHAYKHMNQKLFATLKESVICAKIKKIMASKKQKRADHKPVPTDEDIHQFHELLDMIDRPANTDDYNIPQVHPKPAEPTQSVVELPKPQQAPASPPPLEAIEEELEFESEQQMSEQDGIESDMISVVEENLITEINKNKQCINEYSEIEITECNESSTNLGTEMAHMQFNNCSLMGIEQAKEQGLETSQSDNMIQSSQKVPPFQANSDQQEGVGSQCIIVEAEVHDF